MAFNPLDYLKDLVPQNTNMFGASPNANLKQMAEMGLLGDMDYTDMLKKANKQSIFQGLLNTGLSYAAQPKNQGYGSIFPYLAKAGLAGVQAAQSPYDQLTQNAMTSAKLQEMKRAKDKEALKDKFLSTWGQDNTGNMRVNGDQMVNVASQGYATGQDYGVGSSLMGARNAPNPMNIVSPNFNTNQSSIQSLLDNQLLGTDPESFLLDNNNLEQQMVGSFDSMKAIDDAVANGALELKDALAMKASIATSKADEVMAVDTDKDVISKSTGNIIREGKNNKSQVLSEAGLQNFEKNQGYEKGFYPRADANGNPYIYQFNKDGKLDVTDIGGNKGFSFTLNDKKDQGLSEVAIKDLVSLRDDHTRARKNLPKIDGIVTALIKDKMGLDAGVYTGAFANFKLEADKFQAAVRNIKEKNPTIPNTEILDMALNSDVFPLIKELGIGAKGMDTPTEREFLIQSMVGSKTMSSEALLQATLTRRGRLISTAREFNESSGSDLYQRATKQGVRGLDKKYQMSEEMLRGPLIDVSTYNGEKVEFNGKKIYKYADGTMVWAETGEIAYKPKGY